MNNHALPSLLLLFLLLTAGGCASNNDTRLGDLTYYLSPDKAAERTKISQGSLHAEAKHLSSTQDHYIEAIKSYEGTLKKYPAIPNNAEAFYQLAKVYDLEGNQAQSLSMLTALVAYHPTYKRRGEVYFRKAEIHYNQGEYELAQTAYQESTKYENHNTHIKAYYMLGWAQLKQGKHKEAINNFVFVLDALIDPAAGNFAASEVHQPMVDDCIASISLALRKVGGAHAISELTSIYNKGYAWLIYDHLGDFYLESELFLKAADTYGLYNQHFGKSDKAVQFSEKIIEALQLGDFPTLALEAKANYITLYGKGSEYLALHPKKEDAIFSNLHTYLEELGRHHYVEGQTLVKLIAQDHVERSKNSLRNLRSLNQRKTIAFLRAANYYGKYISTFPYDAERYNILYLQAESLFQAEQYLISAKIYDRVAYDKATTKTPEEVADSAYASIIAYQNYLAQIDRNRRAQNRKLSQHELIAVRAMTRFFSRFDHDTRAVSVLSYAANYMLQLGEHRSIIAIIDTLLVNGVKIAKPLRRTAYGIKANLYFSQEKYALSEVNYLLERNLVNENNADYNIISEKIAHSVYQQSKQLEATDPLTAANHLLRIRQVAPGTKIQAASEHDAVDILMRHEKWSDAISELQALIDAYPNNAHAQQFHRKIAFALQKNGQAHQAAERYAWLSENDADAQVRREALFESATLYKASGQINEMIKYFNLYATRYPEPIATRMEASYRLAKNYKSLGDTQTYLYWLHQIIADHNKLKADADARNHWLASWAKLQYGDHLFTKFRTYPLKMPLIHTIEKKQQYFVEAVDQYEKAAGYGFSDLITHATYQMGQIHEQFSADLLQFELPNTLSSEEQTSYLEVLEQQAAPFIDLALKIYQANIDRAWEGVYDQRIKDTFQRMRTLNPARYAKTEQIPGYGGLIW